MLLSVLRILSTASSITTRIQQAQSRNFDSEPAISLTHRCWVFKFSRGGICACPVLLSVLAVSVPARSSSGNVISPYPLKAFLVSQRKGKGLSGRRRGSAAREIRPAAEILIRFLSFRSTPKAPPVFRRGFRDFCPVSIPAHSSCSMRENASRNVSRLRTVSCTSGAPSTVTA